MSELGEVLTIALYGVSPNAKQKLYAASVNWMKGIGAAPDKASAAGVGLSSGIKSFKNIDKKLTGSGLNEVREFGLYAMQPNGQIPIQDWMSSSVYSERNQCFSMAANSKLLPHGFMSISSVINELLPEVSPVYGIGYRRDLAKGPILYAIGIGQGAAWGEDRREAELIQKWFDSGIEGRAYADGKLRDIYPWNYLTDVHLNQSIGGASLGDWIRQSPIRGVLIDVAERVSLWRTDGEGAEVESIRSALNGEGLLLCV